MPKLGWIWLIGFSALPSITVLLSSIFIPESPRYLCVKGREMEAQDILIKVAEMNRTALPPGTLISSDDDGDDDDQRRMEIIIDGEPEPPLMEKSPLISSSRGGKKI